jgi:hypothetical protein
MSWSVSAEHVPYDQSSNDALLQLKDAALSQNAECSDQFDAAVAATVAIIASGSLGPPSHTFRVRMSGHSNPGHGPRDGWANDAITISIDQE